MKNLTKIPGVGKSIASNLWHIGIRKVDDLAGQEIAAFRQKVAKKPPRYLQLRQMTGS